MPTSSPNLQAVARAYIAASASSLRPLKATAEEFGLSERTAARRIAEARACGLIPDSTVPTNPRVAAIAAELGVSVDAVLNALRKHAPNGDLRVRV